MEEEEKQPEYEILPDDYPKYDLSFKIIIIGNSGVGKSCLSVKATKNIFENNYLATVGFEFFNFNIKLEERVIRLQIWDTCGQEIYRSLITNFYRNSSLAIIVYAINSKDSFANIETWLRELRTHANPDVKIFLIGNKIDLENEREILTENGKKFYEDNKLNLFMEASAKSGFNAQNIFIKAAQILYEDYNKYHEKSEDADTETTERNNTYEKTRHDIDLKDKKEKKGCC